METLGNSEIGWRALESGGLVPIHCLQGNSCDWRGDEEV